MTTDSEPAKQAPGPYWLYHTDTEIQVQGRHGKIVRRYPLDQKSLADADVRRLSRGYAAEMQRLHDAAPELLEALTDTLRMLEAAHHQIGMHPKDNKRIVKARALIAKIEAA